MGEKGHKPNYPHHLAPDDGIASVSTYAEVEFDPNVMALFYVVNHHCSCIEINGLDFVIEICTNVRKWMGLVQ